MAEETIAETADYAAFKARVKQKTGIDLNLYKQQQMHRRLLSLLEKVQVKSFVDYFAVLERDPNEWKVFLDRMTINVSELFRNPEKWEELRRPILTEWLARGTPGSATRPFKVWSAGCSYGAEPYSLAILLDQIASGMRHTLHATDLDRTILAKAREGHFTQSDIKNVPPAVLERYFTRIKAGTTERVGAAEGTLRSDSRRETVAASGRTERATAATATAVPAYLRADVERTVASLEPAYQVRDEIRARITFSQQNLLADRFDEGYDLICCRNVVIYFTDDAKADLYRRFHKALRPGGVLFVGGTERIFESRALGFEMPLPFFYRKTE